MDKRWREGSLALVVSLGFTIGGAAQGGPYWNQGYEISAMQEWATGYQDLHRGPMDFANPQAGDASHGIAISALGAATGDNADVLSLGDGGSIVITFASGIGDGPSADFAVFENGFWTDEGLFAEFAFVEVSSNGVDFARFDSISLQSTPIDGGMEVDPTNYYNLAGEHEAMLGTGFDLSELATHALVTSGQLDLLYVTHVRVIDVIGDGSTDDSYMNAVYDPYPTPFATGGFDLDAVGVINVPEPGAPLMLAVGVGFLGLLDARRRRLRQMRGAALLVCVIASAAFAERSEAVSAGFDELGTRAPAVLAAAHPPATTES